MALLLTIFVLVFLTELISWIGKSVLLDLVSGHHDTFRTSALILLLLFQGICPLSTRVLFVQTSAAAQAQV
jgi:tail-anchored protein insertion receptor